MLARLVIVISLVAAATFAWASDPPKEAPPTAVPQPVTLAQTVAGVQAFYAGVTDFKASFSQIMQRRHMPRPLHKTGTVFFKRPGMMRWDYLQPDRVYYISDGATLWSYEPSEQVVYKVPVKDSELYGALKFLFGQGDLQAGFEVVLGTQTGDHVTLELTPKDKQSAYKRLLLHVSVGSWQIVKTELVDPLDNVSQITFEDVTYEPLKPEGFKFTPPEGVRVQDFQDRR
jgi:outer membrane lipoprotein carrier protein